MKVSITRDVRRYSGQFHGSAIQVICLGSGGGPSEDNVTGFLVRAVATKWSKNSVIAVDAGSHLAAITRMLEQDFPLVNDPQAFQAANSHNCTDSESTKDVETSSPGTTHVTISEDDYETNSPTSEAEAPFEITTLQEGPFAGLPFPHLSARANALHIVREHVSTYLITHPHLDHISGFIINTAAFHNTSRPKRLAALPFTVNAIKTHIFNNIIWPNLTDEDGGVGLVTFQRLAEGGNIALGEGGGRGFIEVCDGLSVKGFKVSHGHCMRGPGHTHRSSNGDFPDPSSLQLTTATQYLNSNSGQGSGGKETRSLSFSLPTQSTPGTPGLNPTSERRRSSAGFGTNVEHCVIDSTAYFIRAESTSSTPKREILVFGDVEPDSLSLSPRNIHIWAEAAPKIAAGILKGIFIEVSFTNATGDAVLFGHLAPRHLLAELQQLAHKVKEAKLILEREREETRKGRKRKRISNSLQADDPASAGPRSKSVYLADSKRVDVPMSMSINQPHKEHEHALQNLQNEDRVNAAVPSLQADDQQEFQSTVLDLRNASVTTTDQNRFSTKSAAELPLSGIKVVIIHVKDTFADGPLVGQEILRELLTGEESLRETGAGLGCTFELSKSGESWWF